MRVVRRVARMSLGELACRARQHADRLFDAVTPAFRPGGEPARWWDRRATAGAAALPRAVFTEAGRHRFFVGVTDSGWRDTPADWTAELVGRATAILEGRFDLLGYDALEFGTPVDWHFDPVSGRRAPSRTHWGRIDPLNPAVSGDSKVIWELNRHQWLVTLGQAYRTSGDSKYAEAALDALDSWLDANPYPHGINWASSLEASYRLIAWCWTFFLLADAPALTDARVTRWQTMMQAHARHVERYLSHYYSPNTHLTGEALGLLYAGIVFAGTADAARWRDLGRRVLIEEVNRQIGTDGTHFEQSTTYQRYTAEIYLHLLVLAARNRLHLPAHVPPAVAALVRGLLTMRQPDGLLPQMGDTDGGWTLPLAGRDVTDPRGVFAVAAVCFDEPDFAWAADGLAPEIAWLLGSDGVRRFRRLSSHPPARPCSSLLPQGGVAVMRSGWDRDAHQLIVDVGPLGCPISSGHGHADLLSLQCVAFGDPFIVDPGTYCYTADRRWRDHFRSTAAHSTVSVDGRSQAEPAGPFSWHARPVARILAWESTPAHDLLDAILDPYAASMPDIRHRRRVLFLKPLGWVVVDDITGTGEHVFDVRLQFSPRNVVARPDGWARADGLRGRGLWVHVAAGVPLVHDLRIGTEDPIDGWVSPDYGVKDPAPSLVVSGTFRDGVRLLTVLFPVLIAGVEPPAVRFIRSDREDLIGVQWPGDPRVVHVDDDALIVEHLVQQGS